MPHWLWYLVGVLALLGTTWVTVYIPYLSKRVVDGFFQFREANSIQETIYLIIGLGFLQMIIRALSRLFLFWPGRQIETEIKDHYFAHFLDLPLPFFQKRTLGDLVSRLANDVAQLRAFFAFGVLQVVNFLFLFSFAIYNMWRVNPVLTILSLAPLFCMIAVAKLASPLFHKYSKLQQSTLGDLTHSVTEAYRHVDIVQANDAVESFVRRIARSVQDVYDANIKLVMVRTFTFPLSTFFTGLSYLAILFYGGREIIQNKLTVGDILAFNIYIALLSFPLTAIGIILALYQRARSAGERLNELEEIEKEKSVLEKEGTKSQLGESGPLLSVRNLTFTYERERLPVLRDLSFDLQEGEFLGISGPIGTGKSTLLHLLTRLYDPPPGTIFFRGQDILEIPLGNLRESLGLVFQTPFIFSGSIAENLAMGRDVSGVELEDSLRRAQILPEIQRMDEGLETLVGEKGVRLSGGQKQRIALARQFLRKPPVLLLDDVAAAVDQETEKRLVDELRKMGSSVILVSHRPISLHACNKFLILKKGEGKIEGGEETVAPLEKEKNATSK